MVPKTTVAHDARSGGALELSRAEGCFMARFRAMASPCEVLLDTDDRSEAEALAALARDEALRIERKFSRYLDDNIVHRINHSGGRPVTVDDETAGLLDYAATCHESSGGLFDITSGALRRAWTFDGGNRIPDQATIREALRQVGWSRIRWENPVIAMPEGMEIDLGGIGKEYAVDRAAALLAERARCAFLINFGGDLFASGARRETRAWGVGLDDPARPGEAVLGKFDLTLGALATSGDARRFVMWQGRRLGHILDPRTGWPVEGAPRAVTVLGSTCLEAGTLATIAYLQGPRASAFLAAQGVQHWVL
jgi:thiamine biosynthesis lipoprotein